jgi:selenocysteine-specific elongation factor
VSDRRGVVVGTAGHVDHGKTALVRALTGVETDRWREERERGLTIDIGFAPFNLASDLEAGIVDVPGHEDFLKNMLAGATGIDVLLLVIAADEGPMPQTREHLAIARLLGISHGVVALTKRDKVDDDWLALAVETTRELMAEDQRQEAWIIVPVSATTGEGLNDLRAALAAAAQDTKVRPTDDLFRLPVDRGFSIHGTGTVVTGTIWSGVVRVGDSLRLFPGGEALRVRGLQVHGDKRQEATAGRRCAVAVVGATPTEAERGSVLVADSAWSPLDRLGVRVQMLPKARQPLEHGQRIRVYLGTREVMARTLTFERESIPAGSSGWAVLALESPLLARTRDRAILRFYSPLATIGGARIVDLDPARSWMDHVEVWHRILQGSDADAFEGVVKLAGSKGLPIKEAPLRVGCSSVDIDQVASQVLCERIGKFWFSLDTMGMALKAVEETMRGLHENNRRATGVSKEALRSALMADYAPELIENSISQLLREGGLEENGPLLSLPDQGVELTQEEIEACDRLLATIVSGGLQPPRVTDLARNLKLSRPVLDDLLRLLQERGATKAVTPEMHVAMAELDRLVVVVQDLLANRDPAPPTVFKEALGVSRKYLIPLLEYLDLEGVTRRTGEGRVLGPR